MMRLGVMLMMPGGGIVVQRWTPFGFLNIMVPRYKRDEFEEWQALMN